MVIFETVKLDLQDRMTRKKMKRLSYQYQHFRNFFIELSVTFLFALGRQQSS